MPSARATPGSLSLGYCCAMNQALRIPIAVILCWIMFFAKCFRIVWFLLGRCLWPGLLRARFARLLLRNELNPTYPYRGFDFRLKYFFLRSVSELFEFIWRCLLIRIFYLDNLGASLRVGLLRITLRYRTSCGWFPFGSYESLAQFFNRPSRL